jgi:hypothetical protein
VAAILAAMAPAWVVGEAGTPATVVSLPARGRPPEAAARRAGLEGVEKSLPAPLNSTDTTEQNAMRCIPPRRIGRAGYWLRVVLVVVAVAQRRLGPSSSATTSTTERALPSLVISLVSSCGVGRSGRK